MASVFCFHSFEKKKKSPKELNYRDAKPFTFPPAILIRRANVFQKFDTHLKGYISIFHHNSVVVKISCQANGDKEYEFFVHTSIRVRETF